MTDIEIIRHCAEAMGFSVVKGTRQHKNGMAIATEDGDPVTNYDPLKHDAQAMALVKKFRLLVDGGNAMWCVHGDAIGSGVVDDSLNRAICECIAKARSSTSTTVVPK